MEVLMKKISQQMLFVILSLYLCGLSSCNFPGLRPPAQDFSADFLRQTLAAQGATATQSAAPSNPESTAAPYPTAGSATPVPIPATAAPLSIPPDTDQTYYYLAQPGDTLLAVARRFNVSVDILQPQVEAAPESFLPHGLLLTIPNQLPVPLYPQALLPDSEVVQSPTTVDLDIQAYIDQAGGFLSTYGEQVTGGWLTGAQIIERVALESSVNARFLLALLDFRSGWVTGHPAGAENNDYPIGFHVPQWIGLYRELVMTATHLNAGYYGWRDGSLTEMKNRDAKVIRMAPKLNAGSAAVQYLFAKLNRQAEWEKALYGEANFIDHYRQMFGDPWARAEAFGPLFPESLEQPTLELPYKPGQRWSLTAGPHQSWKTGSPRGAIDLAPVTGEPACTVSKVWVLASAAGVVARSARNVVIIDLDGDGYEQTGWAILYMHIADFERIAEGTRVEVDDPIGHPSCEGGTSTGTHVHIARKYNGEWIAADGPLSLNLGGWVAHADVRNYYGEMRKGEQLATASPVGPRTSIIVRE